MSEITLQAIEELMDNMLDKKLEPIIDIQNTHTAMLEQLVSEKKTKDDGKIVTEHRIDRLEKWGQEVGKKVDIKLEL